MKKFLNILKTTLIGGVLVVAPAWLAVLLLLKALQKLGVAVKPISDHLPKSVGHPVLVALLLVIVLCFLVGAALRTVIGRRAEAAVKRTVLDKVPGYRMLNNVAEQVADTQGSHGFKPALVEIEDALQPGFIVEEHPDGRYTVFLPSVPTPIAGTIFIIARERVHPVNVPVTTMFKCVTKWGAGSGELLAGMLPNSPKSLGG